MVKHYDYSVWNGENFSRQIRIRKTSFCTIFSLNKRDVTIELKCEGFYKTGIRSDICQVNNII